MNRIEELRDELHQQKESFDRRLNAQPLLTREQRLARWEAFLVEMKPLAVELQVVERHQAIRRERRSQSARYGDAVPR